MVNRLTKQVEKLASEKCGLQREKAELQRQVGDLSAHVQRNRQEKVELENALEQEEEAVVNRLQRQLQQVTTAYRALEARMEACGMSPREGMAVPIDATTEWVYGRSSSRLTGSRRERSLSVSSSSSMRGGEGDHHHHHHVFGGHGAHAHMSGAGTPHAHGPHNALFRQSAQSSQASDLANAMNAQTL